MLTPTAGTKTTSALAARAMAAVRRGHARPGPRGPADNGGDHPCRRLPVRSMASSPFPDFPVPEAIRDAVKSSVLDAATKEDSDFWRGHGQGGRGQGRTLRQGLGQRQAEAEGLEVGDSSSAVQGQGQGQGLGLGPWRNSRMGTSMTPSRGRGSSCWTIRWTNGTSTGVPATFRAVCPPESGPWRTGPTPSSYPSPT